MISTALVCPVLRRASLAAGEIPIAVDDSKMGWMVLYACRRDGTDNCQLIGSFQQSEQDFVTGPPGCEPLTF
jgi:hypothetical protein